jgi:hypothetical protein
MKMKRFCTMSLAGAVVAAFCAAAFSQVSEPPPAVLGSGGGSATDGTLHLSDTVAQPAIGVSIQSNTVLRGGFWYVPDRMHIGPTSAVAIAMFEAAVADGGIELHWSIAGADGLEGFNVYRSAGDGTDFVRLNDDGLVAPAATSYLDAAIEPGTVYRYQIGAVDRDGEFRSAVRSVTSPRRNVELFQNHPNPFNPSTTIGYYLPRAMHVTLTVYDVRGARVRTLVDRPLGVGHHSTEWDGTDTGGSRVGSGVYFYRLRAGNKVITKKLVVVK